MCFSLVKLIIQPGFICACDFISKLTIVHVLCFITGEPGAPTVPLAEPQCQTQWSGWHGAAQQDQWGCHCGEPQEEIHGWLHLCILCLQSQFTAQWGIAESPLIYSVTRLAEWSFTVAVSNRSVLGGDAFHPDTDVSKGAKGLSVHVSLNTWKSCYLTSVGFVLTVVQNVNKTVWKTATSQWSFLKSS